MSSHHTFPTTHSRRRGGLRPLGLLNDLKLLFASLGAGGAAIPLGDSRRAARLLAEYAASLHRE